MTEVKLPSKVVEEARSGRGVLVWSWMSRESPPRLTLKLAKQLPFRIFITTGQGDHLLHVLERADRRPLVIARDEDIPGLDEDRTTIIQLYNANSGPRTLRQYQHYHEQETPKLLELVRGIFATRVVLLAHWDPRDKALKLLYRAIARDFASHRPSVYALITEPLRKVDETHWQGTNHWHLWSLPAELERDPVESFLFSLTRAVNGTAAVHRQEPPSLGELGSPYKHLDYFEEHDEYLFFGRDAESRRLAELALTHRLLLLFGPSGAGKTSLIRAGATPHLRRWGVTPLYIRPGNDPTQALESALCQNEPAVPVAQMGYSEEQNPESGVKHRTASFHSLLRLLFRQSRAPRSGPRVNKISVSPDQPEIHLRQRLHDTIQQEGKKLVVFMDQFEELLTGATHQAKKRSARILGELVNDRSIDWHLIVSIREDFMAELHSLSPWLPGLFEHRLRLQSLSYDAARAAIEEPADVFSLDFEDGLVDAILGDLTTTSGVEPPQLQIVCSSLWRDLQEMEERTFSWAGYERLGRAQEILVLYLKDALTRIVAQECAAEVDRHDAETRRLLKVLIVSKETETPIPMGKAAQRAQQDPETTKRIIQELASDYMVSRFSDLGEELFELSDKAVGLVERHKATVEKVLKSLVTSERTKALLTSEDVAQRTGLDTLQAERLLEALVRNRLLRSISGTEREAYELCHEHLVPEIASWIDQDEMQAKQIHDMLQAELYNWHQLKLVMGRDSLELIQKNAENPFLNPSQEEMELWLWSVLHNGGRSGLCWLVRIDPNRVLEVLDQACDGESVDAKIGALRVACALEKQVESAKYRHYLAVGARASAKKVHQEILSLLIKALSNDHPSVRVTALEALKAKGNAPRKVLACISALRRDNEEEVRQQAGQVLQTLAPVRSRNLGVIDHLQPMLVASVATIAVVMGIWTFRLAGLSREMASWQAVMLAIGMGWILYLNAERQVSRAVLFLLNGAFLTFLAGALASGARALAEKPDNFASTVTKLDLIARRSLALAGSGLALILLLALLLGLYWTFSAKSVESALFLFLAQRFGNTRIATCLIAVWSRLSLVAGSARKSIRRLRQRVTHIATLPLEDWTRTISGVVARNLASMFQSLRRTPKTVVARIRNASFRRDLLNYRLGPVSSQICRSSLRYTTRIVRLLIAGITNGAVSLACIVALVYLYFLVHETHTTIFASIWTDAASVGALIPTLQHWFKAIVGPILEVATGGHSELIVVVAIFVLPILFLAIRISNYALTRLIVLLGLCLPLIFIPSQVRAELMDWASISQLGEIWRKAAMAVQPWLTRLPVPLGEIDFVLGPPSQPQAIVVVVIIAAGWLILVSSIWIALNRLMSRPMILLTAFLPFALLAYYIGQMVRVTRLQMIETAQVWLPKLETLWTTLDPTWKAPDPGVNVLVAVMVGGLLLWAVGVSAGILLWPVVTTTSRRLYMSSLLCMIPALYAYAQQGTPSLILVSIGTAILVLCILTLFPNAFNHLRGQQALAFRIFGASFGCAISATLGAAWFSSSTIASLSDITLEAIATGAIAGACALAGFARPRSRPSLHHSLRAAIGMLLVGPVAWILVTIVAGLQMGRGSADQSILAWVYFALARYSWINVLMATLFSCTIVRRYLAEYKSVSDWFNGLFPGLRQWGTWTKLVAVWSRAASEISRRWQWITTKSSTLQRAEVHVSTWRQTVRHGYNHLARTKLAWSREWEMTKDALFFRLRVRSRRARLVFNLVTWAVLAILASFVTLSVLVDLLASVHDQWGVNSRLILTVGELAVSIIHDPQAIAWAIGLYGGLGVSELLIAEGSRYRLRQLVNFLPRED